MREISELQAIDFALGSHIAGAFTNLASSGPSQFVEFLARPVAKKIYRHDFESPSEFMRSLRASKKHETTGTSGKVSNLPELPIVGYSRKPGVLSNDDKRPMKHLVNAQNDDKTVNFEVLLLPVVLEYKVGMVAWDMPTLDKLQLLWYAHTAFNDKFPALWMIGDEPFETTARIEDHQSLIFSNISETGESGRLFATETDIRISVQVVIGKAVTIPDEITLSGFHVSYLE